MDLIKAAGGTAHADRSYLNQRFGFVLLCLLAGVILTGCGSPKEQSYEGMHRARQFAYFLGKLSMGVRWLDL